MIDYPSTVTHLILLYIYIYIYIYIYNVRLFNNSLTVVALIGGLMHGVMSITSSHLSFEIYTQEK